MRGNSHVRFCSRAAGATPSLRRRCRASLRAATKSWVELNPRVKLRIWNFNALLREVSGELATSEQED